MIETLEPEVATTVQGIRQLSEAEQVACHLRMMAADLNRQADALEIAYGIPRNIDKKVEFMFSARKTPRTKNKK